MFDVGHWSFVIGRWAFDVGRPMFGSRDRPPHHASPRQRPTRNAPRETRPRRGLIHLRQGYGGQATAATRLTFFVAALVRGRANGLRPIRPHRSRHGIVTGLSPSRRCGTVRGVVPKLRVASKILVVDDEPDAVELVEFNLKAAGYEVVTAADGEEALRKARGLVPDLMVLDWMLPAVDGLEVCKMLRRDAATASIPILMLTAKAAEIDRVLGLELGADDYVTKPFSPRELVLRIKNLLNRGHAEEAKKDRMQFGELLIDVPRHLVCLHGKAVELTATEFKLLTVLAQRRGRVQSREQLLHDVWAYDNIIDTRTVDTHMRRLREKLGRAARYLDTVRGVGYRFLDA
jgi:DNA-binding response OmpR family regulator